MIRARLAQTESMENDAIKGYEKKLASASNFVLMIEQNNDNIAASKARIDQAKDAAERDIHTVQQRLEEQLGNFGALTSMAMAAHTAAPTGLGGAESVSHTTHCAFNVQYACCMESLLNVNMTASR
jgi:hypothetical protein